MMCQLCGEFIEGGMTVGFGDGTGQQFVHGLCYDKFDLLLIAMFGRGTITQERKERAVAAYRFVLAMTKGGVR